MRPTPPICWSNLNILWTSYINPRINAYTQIYGDFNFGTTPLTPAGCKMTVHDSTDKQTSWAKHSTRVFYIGPAPRHFCCYRVYIPDTKSTRISNTVEFFPHMCNNPIISSQDWLKMILKDLAEAFTAPAPAPTIPIVQYDMELNDAIC